MFFVLHTYEAAALYTILVQITSLQSTLANSSVSAHSKRVTRMLNLLESTLMKKPGGEALP